jgi:hypothetical protein
VKTTFLFTSWMHLGDEALAGAALQQQARSQNGGDTALLSPAAQAHLSDCPRCLARLDDLRAILDGQRQGAADLADARFPESRLDAQRAGILARLAERHVGARVLMFPSAATPAAAAPFPDPQVHAGRVTIAARMVAATVAASFLLGLLSAEGVYLRAIYVQRAAAAQQQADRDRLPHIPRHHVRWKAESGPDALPGDEADDRLLGEIETLARGRRNPALRALDDMTPRAPGSDSRSHRYRER